MAIVLDFAWAAQVFHKAAMGKRVDCNLRGLLGDGQHEFTGSIGLRALAVATYEIEITTTSCIKVMNHAACLSSS